MDIINTSILNNALSGIRRDLLVAVIHEKDNAVHFADDLEIIMNLANALPELKLDQIDDHSEAIEVLHAKREDIKHESFYGEDIEAEIFKLTELAEMLSTLGLHLDINDFEVFSDLPEYIKNGLLEACDIPDIVVAHTNWEALANQAALDYGQFDLSGRFLLNMDATTFYWRK